jgi:peptidyl-Lys metalloendopeptidase
MRRLNWLVGCVVGVSLLGACGAPPEDGEQELAVSDDARELDASAVTVTLSAAKSSLAMNDSAMVDVTLTNAGSHAVRLLRWHTPVDGVKDSLFALTRDGEPVTYLGAHYKRPAPTSGDYLRLAPGESLKRTVDLASVYDLSQTGSYSVRYDLESMHHGGDEGVSALRSEALTLWVEGRQSGPQMQADDSVNALFGTITYAANCSSTRRTSISSGLNTASSYANNSVTYLNGTPGSKPRYVTWFGTYVSSRWTTVRTHFVNIKGAIDSKPLSFDCGCTDSAYAYVYPTQPYKIYLCSAFWSAPTSGTDSKAGTIIHELSHFNVVAATDDRAYGQTAAKSLARSNPAGAVDNADSHEYFAENTPFQN